MPLYIRVTPTNTIEHTRKPYYECYDTHALQWREYNLQATGAVLEHVVRRDRNQHRRAPDQAHVPRRQPRASLTQGVGQRSGQEVGCPGLTENRLDLRVQHYGRC